jgi:hypothetical protein
VLSAEERRKLVRCRQLHQRGILTDREALCRLGAIARPDNLDLVVADLPPELVEPLKAQVRNFRPVRAVGYWCSSDHPPSRPGFPRPLDAFFPDPRCLVGSGRDPTDRELIVAYLRSGQVYARWRGLSYCRFRCGIDPSLMGSRCLTDGAWVWPEGLAHYVEAHSVRLPEEFMRGMEARGWAVPCDDNLPCYDTQGEPDYDFWVAWGRTAPAADTA